MLENIEINKTKVTAFMSYLGILAAIHGGKWLVENEKDLENYANHSLAAKVHDAVAADGGGGLDRAPRLEFEH
jgi:hypothetical protein